MVEVLQGTTPIEVEVVAMEEAVEVEGVAAAVTIVACLATSLQTVEMEVVVAEATVVEAGVGAIQEVEAGHQPVEAEIEYIVQDFSTDDKDLKVNLPLPSLLRRCISFLLNLMDNRSVHTI